MRITIDIDTNTEDFQDAPDWTRPVLEALRAADGDTLRQALAPSNQGYGIPIRDVHGDVIATLKLTE